MSDVPQPKMFNSKKYRDNYDEIFWSYRGTYCFNCGMKLNHKHIKEHPDLYIFHKDGEIEHKNGCNFN